MTISINDVSQAYNATQLNATKPSVTSGDAQANFADSLKGAIENLNTIQMESDAKTTALANGNIDDLHDVMITAQKASVTLETTVQVQKKVIDAYNEIMRMQVIMSLIKKPSTMNSTASEKILWRALIR